ncbi:hypothetical protein ULMS_18450 [Patiriisocius marinistellae]|uniref:Uncharacterized protein n=1 Tax=Patiriisocius marinistellae TaxID=2494560 RepID=A0A5J4FUM4_9FLAO|nr:S41 family peptidase [Patiriisocius marinistellae]GEQ86337.1 hypothetical protein ULMS_18450 [Patiriisocius marinistellae]
MKTLLTLILTTFLTSISIAQIEKCDCKKDLDFTVAILKKTASYKDQIKGKKEAVFNNTYDELSAQMATPISLEKCFKLLLQQKAVILDLHQSISFNTEILNEDILKDSIKLNQFKGTAYFSSLPKTNLSIKTLKESLKQKPANSIEGIYNYKDLQLIGIYQTDNPKVYAGVILENSLPQWEVGMIKFYATNTSKNKYDFYAYKDETLMPRLVPSLSFDNGRVWNLKSIDNNSNVELSTEEEKWVFKQLSNNIQYVAFKDFSAYSTKNRNAAKAFLKECKEKINTPYLIVDLRDNVGGSKYLSDKFLKPFKKSGAKIYVITNMFTGSNGEQFTTKLLKIENSVHIGQTTFGIIAYGIDDAPSGMTPSGHFYIQGTNMDFGDDYLQYEGIGVVPTIKLDFNTDWIKQTKTLISNN